MAGNGSNAYQHASVLENDIPVILTPIDDYNGAVANGIAISGNDVYVVGSDEFNIEYWKNGKPVKLSNGSAYGYATSIAISGILLMVHKVRWQTLFSYQNNKKQRAGFFTLNESGK